jgi:hypothetical protein
MTTSQVSLLPEVPLMIGIATSTYNRGWLIPLLILSMESNEGVITKMFSYRIDKGGVRIVVLG